MGRGPTGLYVHIPFCSVKCRFCDFAAYPGRRGEIPRYLAALAKEIAQRAAEHPGRPLETFFVGGGTPSLLPPADILTLARVVRDHFAFVDRPELTLECNPETIDPPRLEALRSAGFNRLSLGLQTTEDPLLKALGRTHDLRVFHGAFRLAREFGFDNLNIDLMYGLPGQTRESWRETLQRVVDLGPEHVSAYALTVQPNTPFRRSGVVPDDDLQADLYESAAWVFTPAGFDHYEISNFARPGRVSRHNLRYWRNQDCLGAGVSAAWYVDGCRRTNTDNLSVYLLALEAGETPVVEEIRLSDDERVGEDLILGFRLREGVAPTAHQRRLFDAAFQHLVAQGLLPEKDGRYCPTRRGWLLSNTLSLPFLSPPRPREKPEIASPR